MDSAIIAALISIGLSLAATFFGVKYRRVKALLKTVIAAIEDDEISDEEVQDIMAQAKELVGKAEG